MSLKVVDRIMSTSGIAGLTVDAVELFGSNASYEYDDASDFGIHVFAHSPALSPKDLGGVLTLLNDEVERRQEGRILFNGVPLEVVFHGGADRELPAIAGDRAVLGVRRPLDRAAGAAARPVRSRPDGYGYEGVHRQAQRAGVGVHPRQGGLRMFALRRPGQGDGSRSTQNLTYRALRRINVNIPAELDELQDECTFTQESIG